MRRGVTVDGEVYTWSEYLLHNVERGYAWITEYNGHFNFVHACSEMPKKGAFSGMQPSMKYLGHTFRHFQKAQAKVSYVNGEFYWRVKVGEAAECSDYVSPPLMLSSEKTGKEVAWSLGEYVAGPEVFKAFGVKAKPPRPVGVAANQPSPHKGYVLRYWLAFLVLLAVGLIAQIAFKATHPSTRFNMPYESALTGNRAVSPPFELGGWGATPVTVRISSNASTDWVSLDMQLTNADTGQAFALKRQLGMTRVGGQLEGSTHDIAEFDGVPPGRYTLAVNAIAPRDTAGTIEVVRAERGWSNFWLLVGFLFLWPVVAGLRALSFETKRWSESDYAASSGDDDDGED